MSKNPRLGYCIVYIIEIYDGEINVLKDEYGGIADYSPHFFIIRKANLIFYQQT
jgi:hypothetical protein